MLKSNKFKFIFISFIFIFILNNLSFVSHADDSDQWIANTEEDQEESNISTSSTSQSTASINNSISPQSSSAPKTDIGNVTSGGKNTTASKNNADNIKKTNLEDRLAQLKSEAKKIQTQLSQISSNKKDAEQNINTIRSKIGNLEEQIEIVNQQVNNLSSEINRLEKEIENKNIQIQEKEALIQEKELEYKENYSIYKERIKSVYMSGETSHMEVLLGSSNFSDFFDNIEYLKSITKHDKNIMESLAQIKLDIEDSKKIIEKEKQTVESNKAIISQNKQKELNKKAELEETKKELNNLKSIADSELSQISQEEKKIQYEMTLTKEEIEKIESEIKEIIKRNTVVDSPYVGGQLQWPVPGYYKISCQYMEYTNHTGMDITGNVAGIINKKPFVAAGDGKVISVIYGSTGYGYYCMVDHGGGIVTLYAHASSISVNVGDSVKAGQQLGTVGSTGNSSGPHLHFEVRINGQHKNPKGYLTS